MNDPHITGIPDLSPQLDRILAELCVLREQQEARSALDILNARLAAIVESSDDAIISKSLQGIIQTWNAGATRIFGYTAAEMIGQPILKLLPDDRKHEEVAILERLCRGERMDHFVTQRVSKDGRIIDVSLTISPIRDASGNVVGASKIARDITQQRRYEADLKAAKDEAERANAAKDQFLAVLSHELRTPMMPVLAGLTLIERGTLSPEELAQEIASMRRHVALEVQLIDDLLDHTRISRGKVQLQREITDVHELLRAVIAMCRPEFAAKDLEIFLHPGAEAGHVWGDAKRLHQVFWNLVKNAIKFTPAGGRIVIRTTNHGSTLIVQVTDTGIGIAPDQVDRIFQPFEQGGRVITRQFGGLGLGLAISKSFVELHDGRLEASSEGRGKGATFTVTLPHAMVQPLPPGPSVRPSGRKPIHARTVLLVEDHPDTRRLLARILQGRGHRVDTAGTVAEAAGLLEKKQYDVLVSDIGLPDGSGVDVMRVARRNGKTWGIAVSGFGMPEDEKQSREAGFSLHIAKPVDPEQLEAAIETIGLVGMPRPVGESA
jgi:PAS domain S-box-containing protein